MAIKLDGGLVTHQDGEISIRSNTLHAGTKSIINDIIICSSNILFILIYLECVCKMFQKYRVSFRLDKCDFLKERVEFVGHDLTSGGNCPAKSKFDMINDWEMPMHWFSCVLSQICSLPRNKNQIISCHGEATLSYRDPYDGMDPGPS